MKDINKVICTGIIEREPTMVTLSNGNKIVLFTIVSIETWHDANNKLRTYRNEIDCEIFKHDKNWVKENLICGIRYIVEGFLRSNILNDQKKLCVRVYRVQSFTDRDKKFERAKSILNNSADLQSAKNKINLL